MDLWIIDGITYLYVIHSTSGYFKIGISKDPHKRLKQLDRGALTPFVNTLLLTVPFKDKRAKEMESMFHNSFASKRVNGEWFDLDVFDICRLAKFCARIGDYWIEQVMRDEQ